MANYLEKTNLLARRYVSNLSRYIDSPVYFLGDEKKITFGSYKRHSFPFNEDDKYTVLTIGYEYRPDLLSYDSYGTVDLWWILLEANNISDIFDFQAGTNIRIPSNTFGQLNSVD